MFSLWKDRAGSVAIYTAVVGALLVGSSVLAIDYGRLTVLRTQLQNAADAAAQAGAAQLDAQPNARARAQDVAQSAAQQTSGIAGALTVSNVEVLRDLPNVVALTDDSARFVRVTMAPENANLLFMPVLNLLTGAGSGTTATLQTTATAQSNPILCPPPTILACTDQLDPLPNGNISSPAFAGNQLVLAQRGTAPINFAVFEMLCPFGTPNCNSAQAAQFTAAVGANQCNNFAVSVVQGPQPAGDINDGINSRFSDGPNPIPAPNVIYYPRDQDIIDAEAGPFGLTTGNFGPGNWDLAGYWADAHGTPLPIELSNATRYQVHLFELGVTYAQNGRQTLYPPPATLPAGFFLVTPPGGADIPVADVPGGEDPTSEVDDGIPDPPGAPAIDPKRRVITAAVSTCEGQNLAQPLLINSRFIELFVTERSDSSLIFGEVVGPITPATNDDIVSNAQLVE